MTDKDKTNDPKSNVTPLAAKRKTQSQEPDDQDPHGGTAMPGVGHNKDPLHIRLAERYLELMDLRSRDIRVVPDDDGQNQFWKYENGSWALLLDKEVVKWLAPELQIVLTDYLEQNRKSNNKLFSEATQYIIRHS